MIQTAPSAPHLIREFFSLVLPEELLQEARVLAIRRGADCSLEDALVEGLELWTRRERARPRPEGNDDRFVNSLRLLCCRLLATCFEQLQALDAPGGPPARDSEVWRDALQARVWLLAEDYDSPLSYLNACHVLGIPAYRGRAWARPYLERLESSRS